MEFFLGAFEKEWESRRAALLHDRARADAPALEDEERRRRVPSLARPSPASGHASDSGRPQRNRSGAIRRTSPAEPAMRQRFAALASGSQPAVVKLASFGGGSRLGAMVSYIARGGDVPVENEQGEIWSGRDELSSVGAKWHHLMSNRAASRDIGTFSIALSGAFDEHADASTVALPFIQAALGERSFAYAATARPDGTGLAVEGVAVLRNDGGERLTADRRASDIIQDRLNAADLDNVEFRFIDHGNGADYGSRRLRDLVERHPGEVFDERGQTIRDAKQAGDMVQTEWREKLHSRKPRDVMHLVLSARAGTDAHGFHVAAREFLAQEFGGHHYVFSLHDPLNDPKPQEEGGKRPHVHIHAVVAMRSDAGDRIETTIPAFRRWRVALAEKAREQGIRMQMTDRRDRASPPPYYRNQVRPTSRVGRTQQEGTTDAGQHRYDAKRTDLTAFPTSDSAIRYTKSAKLEWAWLGRENLPKEEQRFVNEQQARTAELAINRDQSRTTEIRAHSARLEYDTHLVMFRAATYPDGQMSQMNRSEFEDYEKRVETALFYAERLMPPDQKENFAEISAAAREHVDIRREIMERGEQHLTDSEREKDDRSTRWDDAVAGDDLKTVDAAHDIVSEVGNTRDAIERDVNADIRALQANLERELASVGEFGAAGNAFSPEIIQVDEELRIAVEAAERVRDRLNRNESRNTGSTPRVDLAEHESNDRERQPQQYAREHKDDNKARLLSELHREDDKRRERDQDEREP